MDLCFVKKEFTAAAHVKNNALLVLILFRIRVKKESTAAVHVILALHAQTKF
jgi:hypothetical protein